MSDDLADRAVALAEQFGPELPEQPGASGVVDLAVTGTSTGEVHVSLEYAEGRVTAAGVGGPSGAELTLSLPAQDAAAVLAGDLAPSVAYMRGRLRTSGDNHLLLGVLAGTAGETWQRWLEALRGGA